MERLREILRDLESCLVAYSGGVDSVFLAFIAHQVMGTRSLAVIADSPSLPRSELDEAIALAQRYGFPVRVIRTNEFDNPEYAANPTNRCFFCKQELFTHLVPLAKAEGFAAIVYGENASDVGDYRPGAAAAAEFNVRAPLKEAGLTKQDIRRFSAEMGLPTADKPQMACLSSRVPYGERVTVEKLGMIERAEAVLRGMGFRDVRVRHHELGNADLGTQIAERGTRNEQDGVTGQDRSAFARCLARIEVGPDELPLLLQNGASSRVAEAFRQIGYAHVTLDLAGYRRGSLNEGIPESKVIDRETETSAREGKVEGAQ